MLEMTVGYGRDLERLLAVLPSKWAPLLYLFGIQQVGRMTALTRPDWRSFLVGSRQKG